MTTQQAFALARQHDQSGRLAEAEALYRQIVAADPRHAEAWLSLGVIAVQAGRNDVAAGLLRQALVLDPANSSAHSALGAAMAQAGQLEEATAAYRQARALRPGDFEPCYNLATILARRGQFDEAAAGFERALEIKSDCAEAHSNLGNVLHQLGRDAEALAAHRRALALQPNHALAHNNLGNTLGGQGRWEEALAAYRRAHALGLDMAELHYNAGTTLARLGRLDEAVSAYRRALELRPNDALVHLNLGNAFKDQGRPEAALAEYRRAVECNPADPLIQSNLGAAMAEGAQFEEATAAYRRALALQPDYPPAHYNLALALLAQGDFLPGWEEHEWRWKLQGADFPQRTFTQPQWDGRPLEGRTIFLHAEQGFGDTLQFVRYAPLVAAAGGRVIVECQTGLQTLLAGVEGISQIIARGASVPPFDVHCPMMSLPRAFATRLETIPDAIPYLQADAQKAALWRERLNGEKSVSGETAPGLGGPLKVGLVWAGAARRDQANASRLDRLRSMPLSRLAPLAGVPGMAFISLQKGDAAEQATTPPPGMPLLDWTAELDDFADTAALVASLDLVISVDTAVAHLAGAMGKPVWVLNRFGTCWRWLLHRSDSPWYPTMRLFRQPAAGDWDTVIQTVAEELRAAVREGRPGSTVSS